MKNDDDLELKKLFLKYIEKTINKAKNHPQYRINENNYRLLSEDAKMALSVLHYINNLKDLVSDLKKTQIFIRRFPNKEYLLENDIDQLSYLKYHYEVFIHKIHTILEVKKLAINDFYKIGLREKDCNWLNLKNQSAITDKPVKKIIENYFKSFEHIILQRNLNTHRAYYGDTKNEELSLDYSIHRNSEKLNYDLGEEYNKIMPKTFLNILIKDYRKEKIEYIKNGTDIAEYYVNQFEIILLNEFFLKIMKK